MIVHPVIGELAIMVDDTIEVAILSDPSLTMKDFTLLKMDLDAAYTLIDVHPAHASKFAVELIGGLVFIFLCGVFGWGSTPACFQVITRALAFEICKVFRGGSKWYVDDFMVVCLVTHLPYNIEVCTKCIVGLLGSGLVADKTETGQQLVFKCYTMDLITGMDPMSKRIFCARSMVSSGWI
jgi:hypothetical protein